VKRAALSEVARETARLVEQGFYSLPDGRIVDIGPAVAAAKLGTVIYDLGDMPSSPSFGGAVPAGIAVTGETTFEAIARLSAEGCDHVGCLNFASAKNPGGGFLNGAQSQEEAVCRCSALYATLLCAPAYYERNRANHSSLYLDLAIVSPNVPFFRTDDGTFIERPALATVITSPAPNAGAVRQNEPQNLDAVLPVLIRRAEMVLRAAVFHNVRNLVLGAWGCGVFRNDPELVALAFASWLKPGTPYANAFERVVFAVFDPGGSKPNGQSFRKVFQDTRPASQP
jgi:uncharacterized protein (TIGR02452 family)